MNPFMYELEQDETRESHYNDIVKLFNALRVEKPQFKLKCRSVAAVCKFVIQFQDNSDFCFISFRF